MVPVACEKIQSVLTNTSLFGLISLLMFAGCDSGTSASGGSTASEDPDPIVAQKAVAGVGKEGQGLKDKQGVAGIIAGPISAMVNVKQKVALEIQVKQAVDLYKALNGRFPESHDEFMREIVDKNRIQLPELPDGAVYHFNSEKGELWVYPEEEVPTS